MYLGLKIALIGHIRSGKDSVADILMKQYNFERFAIADNIKKICEYLYPELMKGGKNRTLQQQVAYDLRKHDEDVWLKLLIREIADKVSPNMNVVITDIRNPSEAAELKRRGFLMVKISASEEIRIERMEAAGDKYRVADLAFCTEALIDKVPYDFEVKNESSIEELEEKIARLLPIIASPKNVSGGTM